MHQNCFLINVGEIFIQENHGFVFVCTLNRINLSLALLLYLGTMQTWHWSSMQTEHLCAKRGLTHAKVHYQIKYTSCVVLAIDLELSESHDTWWPVLLLLCQTVSHLNGRMSDVSLREEMKPLFIWKKNLSFNWKSCWVLVLWRKFESTFNCSLHKSLSATTT